MPRTRSEIFPIMHRIIVHLFTMVKVNALSVSIGNRQCYVFLMPLKMISVSPTAFPPCDLVNLAFFYRSLLKKTQFRTVHSLLNRTYLRGKTL